MLSTSTQFPLPRDSAFTTPNTTTSTILLLHHIHPLREISHINLLSLAIMEWNWYKNYHITTTRKKKMIKDYMCSRYFLDSIEIEIGKLGWTLVGLRTDKVRVQKEKLKPPSSFSFLFYWLFLLLCSANLTLDFSLFVVFESLRLDFRWSNCCSNLVYYNLLCLWLLCLEIIHGWNC